MKNIVCDKCCPALRVNRVPGLGMPGPSRATLALSGASVGPSPATHAILTVLKAGESVFQTLLLTKTIVHVCNHCFIHYFGVKTLSETLFSPPLKKPGYGARRRAGAALPRVGACGTAAGGAPEEVQLRGSEDALPRRLFRVRRARRGDHGEAHAILLCPLETTWIVWPQQDDDTPREGVFQGLTTVF